MKVADKISNFKNKNITTLRIIRNIFVLIVASLSFAAGIELFLAPNNFNVGGFIGIAQIITLKTNILGNGICFLILNLPVIIISWFFFSKRFVIKTAAEILLIGIFIFLFEYFDIAAQLNLNDGNNLSLIALFGGALVAFGIAATLAIEGSSGGTDILGLIVQKQYKISFVSRLLLLFDIAIVALYALLSKNVSVFFYSFTALAAYQITLELIFNSISNAVMLEIITEKSDVIIKAITEELKCGSTVFKAIGTYTKNEKDVVICIVRKRQETKAKDIIKSVEPECFAYVLPIKQVIGKGFRNVNL